jgi:beta-alanine degradation protein BauB
MELDPTVTDPEHYRVVFENDRVRVLEYHDRPGDATHRHAHPDSVMCTLSAFRRVIERDGRRVEVALDAGEVRWLDAQEHKGENVGSTETRSIFVELKEPAPSASRAASDALGPSGVTPPR